MKKLLLSIALLGFAGTANAQTVGDISKAGAATILAPNWEPALAPKTPQSKPLAETIKLEYYDETLQQRGWQVPADYGGLISIVHGQRFTLPTDNGFLDSVRVNFAGAQGDFINVAIVKDTLFETSPGEAFRLIDIFSNAPAFAQGQIPISSIGADGWVTVSVPHIEVPKNFFVIVSPSIQGSTFTSAFVLRGDIKPTRVRTADNARSAMVGIVTANSQTLSIILDSLITFQGEDGPTYTDFFMEAYVDVEGSSVAEKNAGTASVYPNPVIAGSMIRVNDAEPMSSIRIVNALGAEVSSWNGLNSQVEMPIAGIAPGVYHLLITTDSGVKSEKIVVQ